MQADTAAATLATAGFATVREMYAVKDAVLAEMRLMEQRLTAKIEATYADLSVRVDDGNRTHDATHADMRQQAEKRHETIDAMLRVEEREQAVEAAMLSGRSSAYHQIIGALRVANEFRWLILVLLTVIMVFANDLHVSLT